MRGVVVTVAIVCAFAAGWFLRGCGPERAPDAARPVERAATPEAPRLSPPPRHGTRTGRAAPEPEKPARPTGDVEPQRESPAPEDDAVKPAAAKDTRKQIEGIVVDSATGAGVADVMIHLCPFDGDRSLGWNGSGTDAEGRFTVEVLPEWSGDELRLEIQAGRDGYRLARVPVTGTTVRVPLERLARPPGTGRIVGTARDADGKPITGRLFVGISDEMDLHSCGIWTRADDQGRFALDGVVAGHWSVRLAESDASSEVNVVEDADATVELRGEFDDHVTGAFAPGVLDEAAYQRENRRLEGIVHMAMAEKGGDNPWDDPVTRAVMYARQQLEYQWLRHAPGRDVVVTGVPEGGRAYVRLEHADGAGCQFRAAVSGGRARVVSVPPGAWRAVVVRPDAEGPAADVTVAAGEGPVTVSFPPAK